MARRKTTRSKTVARRKSPARRKTTTRRRRSPARKTTTRRRKTTTRRRKSPARRKSTTRRRKSPARRKTTTRRRKTTTRRRKSPARRKSTTRRRKTTTRRRKSPARRKSAGRRRRVSRRRTVSRRRSTGGSRKFNFKNVSKFVTDNMTALEAVGAVSIGIVSGLMLPGYVQAGLSRLGVGSRYTGWMTTGYTKYLAGAATTGVAAFALYSMKAINMQTATAIAVTGTAINALNLLATYGPLAKYLPSLSVSGSLSGFGGYGYLGNAGAMDLEPVDAGMFGVHQGYGNSNSNMFGAGREMNFY